MLSPPASSASNFVNMKSAIIFYNCSLNNIVCCHPLYWLMTKWYRLTHARIRIYAPHSHCAGHIVRNRQVLPFILNDNRQICVIYVIHGCHTADVLRREVSRILPFNWCAMWIMRRNIQLLLVEYDRKKNSSALIQIVCLETPFTQSQAILYHFSFATFPTEWTQINTFSHSKPTKQSDATICFRSSCTLFGSRTNACVRYKVDNKHQQ